MQDADDGDTTTSIETRIEAAEQVEAVRPEGDGIQEVVGDKGYHSNQSIVDLERVGLRAYASKDWMWRPRRGCWRSGDEMAWTSRDRTRGQRTCARI